jgi:hypothetical protein
MPPADAWPQCGVGLPANVRCRIGMHAHKTTATVQADHMSWYPCQMIFRQAKQKSSF